jgi:hypothetical protein
MKKAVFLIILALTLSGCDLLPGAASAPAGGRLIVYLDNNKNPRIWSNTKKLDLTYCIAEAGYTYDYKFLESKAKEIIKKKNPKYTKQQIQNQADDVISTAKNLEEHWAEYHDSVIINMAEAEAVWENSADVEFKYVPSQDGDATTSNKNVVFVVRPPTQDDIISCLDAFKYIVTALSSTPDVAGTREIIIFHLGPYGCAGLPHELGHILGLYHEVEDPPAGTDALTKYDSESIMQPYATGGKYLSDRDIAGITELYGPSPVCFTFLLEPTVAAVSPEPPDPYTVDNAHDQDDYYFGINEYAASRLIKRLYDLDYRLYRVKGISVNGQNRYYLIFKQGDMGEKYVLGKKRDAFVAKRDELKEAGWDLYWLDTFGQGGETRYNALFRKNIARSTWISNRETADFVSAIREKQGDGYQLEAIDIYERGVGEMLHSALFRKGDVNVQWASDCSYSQLKSAITGHKESGFKLSGLDAAIINQDTMRMAALFRKDAPRTKLMHEWDFGSFRKKYKSDYRGWKIRDLAVYASKYYTSRDKELLNP